MALSVASCMSERETSSVATGFNSAQVHFSSWYLPPLLHSPAVALQGQLLVRFFFFTCDRPYSPCTDSPILKLG